MSIFLCNIAKMFKDFHPGHFGKCNLTSDFFSQFWVIFSFIAIVYIFMHEERSKAAVLYLSEYFGVYILGFWG